MLMFIATCYTCCNCCTCCMGCICCASCTWCTCCLCVCVCVWAHRAQARARQVHTKAQSRAAAAAMGNTRRDDQLYMRQQCSMLRSRGQDAGNIHGNVQAKHHATSQARQHRSMLGCGSGSSNGGGTNSDPIHMQYKH